MREWQPSRLQNRWSEACGSGRIRINQQTPSRSAEIAHDSARVVTDCRAASGELRPFGVQLTW